MNLMKEIWDKVLSTIVAGAGLDIIYALLVWIVGRIVIKKIVAIIRKTKRFEALDITVTSFLISIITGLLYTILVVAVISILGVPMASVIAVIASAGMAVGLALQGGLSNLAGGIMLVIFRPFNVGDTINAAGVEGTVQDITLFYTKLLTYDNLAITIPNGTLMNANITNYTAKDNRRMDIAFSIAKDSDIDRVEEVMVEVMKNAKLTLKGEEFNPVAFVSGGSNEGMIITARSWVVPADYFAANAEVTEGITRAFGGIGVKAPAVRVITDK